MAYSMLDYERVGDVASVWLNDPATLNAMSATMGEELRDALRRGQREARAILLGGAGRAFCSGANLGEGGFELDDPDRDAGTRLETVCSTR